MFSVTSTEPLGETMISAAKLSMRSSCVMKEEEDDVKKKSDRSKTISERNGNLDLLKRMRGLRSASSLGRGETDLGDFALRGSGYFKELPFLKAEQVGKDIGRSEERRVGKECRSRWSPEH